MNFSTRLFAICVISLLITLLLKIFVVTDSLYFNSLAEKLSYEQIEVLLNTSKKWEWVGYLMVPIICLLKCSLVAVSLTLGIFFINGRFEFKKMLDASVRAEFVFLLPVVIKLLWFLFIQTSYTLQDFQYFSPLSALNIFDAQTLEPWLVYPLQVLNVFELIYWITLAYFLSKELPELDINRSMTVVMSSYGTGLVIWVALVMFLTLTYT